MKAYSLRECPYEVLRNCAENLTPEQLDYCVREYPAIALLCGAVKLTKKLKKYCNKTKQQLHSLLKELQNILKLH